LYFQEFLDLLGLIFLRTDITDPTVLHILKLADRFQMEGAMSLAEDFLIRSDNILNKLEIADQYRLMKLRNHCLQSFATKEDLIDTLKPQSAQFSDETNLAI
ncbi:hypothetical protein PENTCL1PPCAC_12, partial [Pristionchus entomophagus]